MAKYGFEDFGRVFLPIYIMPKDKSTMRYVEFMVDTGADSTTISKRDFLLNPLSIYSFALSDIA
jgi:predicted aspartyl protease